MGYLLTTGVKYLHLEENGDLKTCNLVSLKELGTVFSTKTKATEEQTSITNQLNELHPDEIKNLDNFLKLKVVNE